MTADGREVRARTPDILKAIAKRLSAFFCVVFVVTVRRLLHDSRARARDPSDDQTAN